MCALSKKSVTCMCNSDSYGVVSFVQPQSESTAITRAYFLTCVLPRTSFSIPPDDLLSDFTKLYLKELLLFYFLDCSREQEKVGAESSASSPGPVDLIMEWFKIKPTNLKAWAQVSKELF